MDKDAIKLYFYIGMCVLSVIQICIYSVIKLRGRGVAYTLIKCAGSLLFVLVAVMAVLLEGFDLISTLMLIALSLCAVGDFLLSLRGENKLDVAGATFFMVAHCIFTVSMISEGAFEWFTIPLIFGIFIVEMVIGMAIKLNLYGLELPVALYLLSLTAMAVQGVYLCWHLNFSPLGIMVGAGSLLFMASDIIFIFYGLNSNKHKDWSLLKVLNVVLYFPAQMLFAGALLLF